MAIARVRVPSGAVALAPARRADSHANPLAFYQRLRDANRVLGCDFFEGVVMKRGFALSDVAPLCDGGAPRLGEALLPELTP